MAELIYLDSSSIIKLVIREAESMALIEFLRHRVQRASSAVARVEVLRSLHRAGATQAQRDHAVEILQRLALIRINDAILESAAELEPLDLRSLDALHLASALSLQPDLEGIVTYDKRLAVAARPLMAVWSPR
jgi:predicted nucleic acid-binding protein